MKINRIFFTAIAAIMVCSFGENKPRKVQRRKGVMNVDAKGKIVFEPLEGWQDFTPVNDTLFQYRVTK